MIKREPPAEIKVKIEDGKDPDLSRRSAVRLVRLLERLEAKKLAREAADGPQKEGDARATDGA